MFSVTVIVITALKNNNSLIHSFLVYEQIALLLFMSWAQANVGPIALELLVQSTC